MGTVSGVYTVTGTMGTAGGLMVTGVMLWLAAWLVIWRAATGKDGPAGGQP